MTSPPQEIPESIQDSESESEFPRLQGKNDYRRWAIQISVSLRKICKERIIDRYAGISPYAQCRDSAAEDFLRSELGEAALGCIQGATTLEAMWNRLRDQYLEPGWVAESCLVSELVALQYTKCDSMKDYISRFQDIVGMLDSIGRKIEDRMLVYLLLSGSDEEHADWLRKRSERVVEEVEPPRFDHVTAQLLDREADEESQEVSLLL